MIIQFNSAIELKRDFFYIASLDLSIGFSLSHKFLAFISL